MNQSMVGLSNRLNTAYKSMHPNTLRSTPAPPPKPVAPPAPIPAAAARSMPYVEHGLSEEDLLACLLDAGELLVTEVGGSQ
tara:strand:- start:410 stop:652 length:243 start_codon:yes stop_codon:yes gene_type:complete